MTMINLADVLSINWFNIVFPNSPVNLKKKKVRDNQINFQEYALTNQYNLLQSSFQKQNRESLFKYPTCILVLFQIPEE